MDAKTTGLHEGSYATCAVHSGGSMDTFKQVFSVSYVHGVDMDNTPPCEALRPHPDPCGKPSTERLLGTCMSCGNHGYFFVCGECAGDMDSNAAGCSVCMQMHMITVVRT